MKIYINPTYQKPNFLGENYLKTDKAIYMDNKVAFKRMPKTMDLKVAELIEFKNIYNNLWKELKLPENLKPRIQNGAILSNLSFSLDDYKIYIKKFSSFDLRIMNKSGNSVALLRHEIEHVLQFWSIIRLLGAQEASQIFEHNMEYMSFKVTPSLHKKMQEIEKTLGKFNPGSKEALEAKGYLENMKKYPDMGYIYRYSPLKQLIMTYQYHNNLLEKNANKKEKEYKPSFFKIFKTYIKEIFSLMFSI